MRGKFSPDGPSQLAGSDSLSHRGLWDLALDRGPQIPGPVGSMVYQVVDLRLLTELTFQS